MWLVLGLSKAIATVPQTWGPTLLVPNPGLAILWPLFKDSEPMTLPESIFRPPQMVGRGSRQQAPTYTFTHSTGFAEHLLCVRHL